MARKVFISVLGSSAYKECIYTDDAASYKSKPVRFVQEAIIEKIASNWTQNDRFIIFVTRGEKGSKEKNWFDHGELEGLESRLKKMDLMPNIQSCEIPDGNTEQEIWQIFEIIYNTIEKNDELHIDITHGFRYLPMLVVVLGNYAQLLKNSTIKSITYGNYEGRNPESNEAPIVNLASFSYLQNWSNAINEFVKTGSSNSLSDIILLEASNRAGSEKQTIEKFNKALNNLTKAISTARGNELYSGKLIKDVIDNLEVLKRKINISVFDPVLEKLEEKLDGFTTTESKINGDIAVKWCLQNNLIQQAYTLGQEHIISLLCDMFQFNYKNKKDRGLITATFGYLNDKRRNPERELYSDLSKRIDDFTKLNDSELIHEIAEYFGNLSSMRNTLNHGGMVGSNPSSGIIASFEKFYNPIISKIKNAETL